MTFFFLTYFRYIFLLLNKWYKLHQCGLVELRKLWKMILHSSWKLQMGLRSPMIKDDAPNHALWGTALAVLLVADTRTSSEERIWQPLLLSPFTGKELHN